MGDTFLFSRILTAQPNIVHGFGTRRAPEFPSGYELAWLKQVHHNRTVIVSEPGDNGEGDAMITNRHGILLTIRTADCVPVLLYDKKNRVVGAVHAGWRGVYHGVVVSAVKNLIDEFKSDPAQLLVAIGPSIEQKCYEIGDDTADLFRSRFPWGDKIITVKNFRPYLNLRAGIENQLLEANIKRENIDQIDLCTYCRGDLFYSYRRDGRTQNRMYSFIGLKKHPKFRDMDNRPWTGYP